MAKLRAANKFDGRLRTLAATLEEYNKQINRYRMRNTLLTCMLQGMAMVTQKTKIRLPRRDGSSKFMLYACQRFDVAATRCLTNYGKVVRNVVARMIMLRNGVASGADSSSSVRAANRSSKLVLRAALSRSDEEAAQLKPMCKEILKELRDAGAVSSK